MEFSPVTVRGAVIQVYDIAGMPEGEWGEAYPWLVVCETHRYSWGSPTLEGIAQMRDEPEHWCRGCRVWATEQFGGRALPLPKPSTVQHKYWTWSMRRAGRRTTARERRMSAGLGLKKFAPSGERAGEFRVGFDYTWTDLVWSTAHLMARGFPTPSKVRVIDGARENLRAWGESYRSRPEWNLIPTAFFEVAEKYVRHMWGPKNRTEAEAWRRREQLAE